MEAIRQGVVKTPVIPDEVSRAKLQEHASDKIAERYAVHIRLGYTEWAKARDRLQSTGKKPILFIMTTTTKESDEVAAHLEMNYPDLLDRVLVIHTNRSGELTGKQTEIEALREASRNIDSAQSPYDVVVSVLMLREGWDVQNVVALVGLRPYTATRRVLPEQTLGRGLRRMFRGDPDLSEYVSVIGTPEFLDFIEGIRSEGVELDQVPMGTSETDARLPLVIDVDESNPEKDVEALEIPLPRLSSRFQRESRNLALLNASDFPRKDLPVRYFGEDESREIVFKDLDTDETAWTTNLGEHVVATPQAVLAYMSNELMRRLRLVTGREILFGVLKAYVADGLFDHSVNLDDHNILRNLSDAAVRHALYDLVSEQVNSLVVVESGSGGFQGQIRLLDSRPAVVNNQDYVESKKSIFSKTIGDSRLELIFAQYLDNCGDVQAFFKNMRHLGFFLEYVNSKGELSAYYPDFVVRLATGEIFIIETKGLEDTDVALKWHRLVQWVEDATRADIDGSVYRAMFIPEDDFYEVETIGPKSFQALIDLFGLEEPLGRRGAV